MKKFLLEILLERSMSFTLNEIYEIINEELEKDTKEMDLELIDICLDTINSNQNE